MKIILVNSFSLGDTFLLIWNFEDFLEQVQKTE